jgi:hypothetical protein
MYFFFTLNSNMFPEFLYHPHLSRCSQTMWKHKPTYVRDWRPVGGSLVI